MKLNLVTLSVFIYGVFSNKLSDELMDDWNRIASVHAAACIEETDANPILAESMFKDHKLIDEEHVKCYMKCLNEKNTFIFPNGTFNRDKFVNDIEHVTYAIIDKCLAKLNNDADLCKKSYSLAMCFSEENYVA
ncbi:hypothetical protein FQR65_LT12144 [Abscondita terminalis]|nr:hypothetical protein FQR65_LT12144 [Abscondita terminalis]